MKRKGGPWRSPHALRMDGAAYRAWVPKPGDVVICGQEGYEGFWQALVEYFEAVPYQRLSGAPKRARPGWRNVDGDAEEMDYAQARDDAAPL